MQTRSNHFMWRTPLQSLFLSCFLPNDQSAGNAGDYYALRRATKTLGNVSAIILCSLWSSATLAIGVGLPILVADPGFMEWSYLKASNTQSRDRFGWAVAMDGNTLAVSAIGEGSAATGVNGDQELFGAARSGAVYVFTLNAGVWSQQAYIKASNTGLEDWFGYSIALSGDTLAVGATRERSGTGEQDDNSAGSSGAVYVYTRDAGVWSQQAYLKASNIGAFDEFGWSVGLDGDTLVVGAHKEDGSASGVNEPSNENAPNSGAAYVFLRSAETWSQQAYLKASNTDENDTFGLSVAISGDTLVVGSEWESSSSIGVGGNQDDNSTLAAGAAYVFSRSGETWTQQAYLKASNTDYADKFGSSVAIETDTLLVGAVYEDSDGTDENNNQFGNSGAAYVFIRNGEVWNQQAYLKASNVQEGDRFGYKVAISGDKALVSAFGEESNATGVDGNQLNNSIPNAGAVYVFGRDNTAWTQRSYLKQFPSGQGQDGFGDTLAISGDTVLIGANTENSNATGVDGDQTSILAVDAGAAYLFKADVFFRNSFE
jgi:hypothetical protein